MVHSAVKKITVRFYRSGAGREPIREWLQELQRDDCRDIGHDIKTVEYGWPLGMPLVEKLDRDLWEVRIDLTGNRIARVFFTVVDHVMVLLHGIIKKTQKTPQQDLTLAKRCRNEVHKS